MSTETKAVHTPGPWTLAPAKFDRIDILEHRTLPTAPHGTKLATVYDQFPSDKANARLIAAAPEMYEALEAILPAIRDNSFLGQFTHFAGGQIEGTQMQANFVRQIEAAIRKAKGESQ